MGVVGSILRTLNVPPLSAPHFKGHKKIKQMVRLKYFSKVQLRNGGLYCIWIPMNEVF